MAAEFPRPYPAVALVPAVDTAAATAVGAFDAPPNREPAQELACGLAQLHQRLNVLTARSRGAAAPVE